MRPRVVWAALRPRASWCGVALALAACHRAPEPPSVSAHFGVFFGGQLQEREAVPLIVDRARQSMGVRLEFATPPPTEQRVTWEVEKPTPGKKGNDTTRLVAYGEARTRIGEAVLDVPLAFQPGDRPGPWRIRVALDGQRLLERAFAVTPATDAPADE